MRYCLSFVLFLFVAYANAQPTPAPDLSKYKTTTKKLQVWAEYCDTFLFVEDFQGLRKAGKKGLQMSPPDAYLFQSLYHFYVGVTFNYGTQTDSAAYYLERSEKFARLAKHNRRLEETLIQLLYAYNTYGNGAKRDKILNELQQRFDTIKDSFRKGQIANEIATYYTDKGEYETGLAYRLASIKARRAALPKGGHNDSINFGVALINVAELYIELENPEKTLEYLTESQTYIKDYQAGIATIYKDFTRTLLQQDKPAEAKIHYQKLVDFLNKNADADSWSTLVEADLALAEYYIDRQDDRLAFAYAQHAVKFSQHADSFQRARINHLEGKICLKRKQYEKALGFFKKAEPVMKEASPELQSSLQKSLAETYAALGNWKLAYEHFNSYSKLQDNLLNEKAKSNLAKMEAQYQNKKKQGEINMLSAENKIKNLEIENAGKQRIFLIIGLVLLLVIVGSLVVIYRNKRKGAQVLEQKNREMGLLNEKLETANTTKAKLFSIIGHDLRSPISHIYQFLDLQKSEPELFSEADKVRHNERITNAASTVLETMEDLLIWSKSQMQQFTVTNEKIRVLQTVENIVGLMQTQIDNKKINLVIAIDDEVGLQSDRNIFTIIVRNLLQNAVKYSPVESTIMLSVQTRNGKVELSIADQGNGIPESAKQLFTTDSTTLDSGHSGLGLTLVKEMADLIGASVTFANNQPNGTVVTISL